MFNSAQFHEVLRIILQIVGAFIISKGYLSADQFTTVSGAVLALGGVGLSIWTRRNTGLVKSAAKVADVKEITVDPLSKSANLSSEKITT